jgi:HD-like signal output (HDOD) protein
MFINGKIKDYIKQMPALPVSAQRVLEICGGVNVNPYDLNRVISLDPVLTGRMLQLLIMSYKGLGPHVTSLVRAVTMLGINTVKNLAISAAKSALLPKNKNPSGMDMTGFWSHSYCVAVITKLLAEKKGIDPIFHEEYFISGLLHDIGMLPLNSLFPAEYVSFKNINNEAFYGNKALLAAEKKQLGINHCKAGEIIAKAWKLEWPVADVIAYHHEPSFYSGVNSNIVFTVAIADYFSHVYAMDLAGDKKCEKPDFHIWLTSGIRENAFDEIKEAVYDEMNKAKEFLRIS